LPDHLPFGNQSTNLPAASHANRRQIACRLQSLAIDKMISMANLTLVYGMRLLPEGEVKEIHDATLKLVNGHEAHVTMHVLEGSRAQIEEQLKQSLDAFFDFYPEI
jgi:hypothetical protein